MSVGEFLVKLAERFESGPDIDMKLAGHCRDFAIVALEHAREYEASTRRRYALGHPKRGAKVRAA